MSYRNSYQRSDKGVKTGCFRRTKKKKRELLIEELTASNVELSQAVSSATKSTASLAQQLEEYTRAKKELEETVQALNKQLTEVTERRDALQSCLASFEKDAEQGRILQETNAELYSENRKLIARVESLKNDINTKTDELEDAQEALDRLNTQLDKARTVTVRMGQEKGQAEAQLLETEAKIKEQENQCLSLKVKFEDEKEQRLFLEKSLKAKELENDRLSLERWQKEKELGDSMGNLRDELIQIRISHDGKKETVKQLLLEKSQLLAHMRDKSRKSKQRLKQCYQQICELRKENELRLAANHSSIFPNLSPNNPDLQTRLMDLEFRLYRREKLIEELEDRIRGFKPEFTVSKEKELVPYLDGTKWSVPGLEEFDRDCCMLTTADNGGIHANLNFACCQEDGKDIESLNSSFSFDFSSSLSSSSPRCVRSKDDDGDVNDAEDVTIDEAYQSMAVLSVDDFDFSDDFSDEKGKDDNETWSLSTLFDQYDQ